MPSRGTGFDDPSLALKGMFFIKSLYACPPIWALAVDGLVHVSDAWTFWCYKLVLECGHRAVLTGMDFSGWDDQAGIDWSADAVTHDGSLLLNFRAPTLLGLTQHPDWLRFIGHPSTAITS
jgi:hypothetical protein